MAANHDAIKALSNDELLRYFNILFKNNRFMGTVTLSQETEYTVLTGGQVGNTPQTETANLAVVFLDKSNEHRRELIDTLQGSYRGTGIKGEDLNQVNPLPSIFREVMTITTNDGETWHLYQGLDGSAPYNHLPWLQQEFARNLFFLTPEGLRKTVDNQIVRAQIDLESLRENMSVENVDTVQKRLKQLAELPDDLLTEDLRVLRSDPDRLNRVKKLLEEAQELLSPEALEAELAKMAAQGGREGAGS